VGICNDDHVAMLAEEIQAQYRRLFEVGEKLAQAKQSLEAKDEELAKLQGKADILQDEVLKRGMQVRNLDERWAEMANEVNDTHKRNEELEAELTTARRRLNLQMDTTAQVEKKLVDALGVLSDRDIEVERLQFALKDKENELESVRDEHRTQIDELRTELNDVKELYYNRLKIEEVQDEEIERLRSKNKQRVKVVELRWLLDGHTDVLDEHRTAILQVREAVDQNKETLSAAQREMLATLDRHDGLISKAFACIDNHSDSIYKQQQSIDALLSAIENQPKTKDDLWTYIRRQMNQQGVGGNNEEEEAR